MPVLAPRVAESARGPLAVPWAGMGKFVCIGLNYADHAAETGAQGVLVVAPGCHDTASAVAAVPAEGAHHAYLSSGTWSLLGVETQAPVINAASLAANVTNEGGVCGTVRLLKNITGLWLLQESRRRGTTHTSCRW